MQHYEQDTELLMQLVSGERCPQRTRRFDHDGTTLPVSKTTVPADPNGLDGGDTARVYR